jgi:DNA mismatch repair protein MutL
MTDVIQLLPDSVANQIAAGEVIQRPASVIKELVENAVDAGAHTINVLVVDAGRTSMQVIDDGCGMSETDARLAFERHATSKIRKADDLFALHTMGFRGEALPSIAAVAQIELRTRRQADEVGTCLTLSGSRVESQEMCSCSVGSSFTVSNLFFNVPARRKFLKTNTTELNNILTAFERIVLVYPEICFTLHSNGQELMNLRAGTLRQRIADVYGRRYTQDLLPVNVETALCKITGFVAKPETARKKGAHEYFFVNGRFMKHAYFHKAVQQAYERLIPSGAHVPYFIYFEVNPADIDVNIHPTKTEIKFDNEQAVWQILSAAVKDAIGQFCEIPQIDFDTEGRPEMPAFNPAAVPVEMPQVDRNPQYNPFKEKAARNWERLYDGLPQQQAQQEQSLFNASTYKSDDLLEEVPVAEQPVELTDVSPLHYQYKGRYIMTAVKSGLMIID